MLLPLADSTQYGKLMEVDLQEDWKRETPSYWLTCWKENENIGLSEEPLRIEFSELIP